MLPDETLALMKSLQDPEYTRRLEILATRQKELDASGKAFAAQQDEVAKQRAEGVELKRKADAALRDAEAKLAEAKRLRDAVSLKEAELETRRNKVEVDERDVEARWEEHAVRDRQIKERDENSQKVAAALSAKQAKLEGVAKRLKEAIGELS